MGFSIAIPAPARLVLDRGAYRQENTFDSAATYSEVLRNAGRWPLFRREDEDEVAERPGDVVLFAGSTIWHARRHAAGAVAFYCKFYPFGADSLGEDPRAEHRLQQATRDGLHPRAGRERACRADVGAEHGGLPPVTGCVPGFSGGVQRGDAPCGGRDVRVERPGGWRVLDTVGRSVSIGTASCGRLAITTSRADCSQPGRQPFAGYRLGRLRHPRRGVGRVVTGRRGRRQALSWRVGAPRRTFRAGVCRRRGYRSRWSRSGDGRAVPARF